MNENKKKKSDGNNFSQKIILNTHVYLKHSYTLQIKLLHGIH